LWNYDKLKEVAIRARHLHIDLKFGGGNRYRMCCADPQMIVNEFSIRSDPQNPLKIIFEPGVVKIYIWKTKSSK